MKSYPFSKDSFSNKPSYYCWLFFALVLCPLSLLPRFYDLNNALIEPHPWRQNQTALTAYYFSKGFGTFFDYRSPYEGKLWNYVLEFPIYQWMVAKLMSLGFSLEFSGRIICLFFFGLGCVFLYKAINELFSQEAALWTLVVYFISPFNIIYSRTVLIDFTVQSFCLISGYYLIRLAKGSTTLKDFVLSAVFGALAGTGKSTVWFSLALCSALYLAYSLFYLKEGFKRNRLFILSLLIQSAIALSWMAWSSYIISLNGLHNAPGWFFGDLSQRIEAWRWRRLWELTARNMLVDFMVIPLSLALLYDLTYRKQIVALLIVIFVPVLLLFNIHIHHDYYFISESPYLFVLVGLGMVQLFKLSNKHIKYSAYLLMLFLFAVKSTKLEPTFSILYHDYRPNVQSALNLKKLTETDDLIYYRGNGLGKFYLPFYSERAVLLGPSKYFDEEGTVKAESLSPTVFWLEPPATWHSLERYKTISLVTEGKEFYIFRVLQSNHNELDPFHYVSVSFLSGEGAKTISKNKQDLRVCGAPKGYGVYKIPSQTKRIEVYSVKNKTQYALPARPYLYLPSESSLGCEFTVSLF